MVVFTCSHCGESIQKPKVAKHYSLKCRNPISLTCVDCLKDFNSGTYGAHIKCISEVERYAAKGTFPSGLPKKGEIKQESWVDMIRTIVETDDSLSPNILMFFKNLLNFNNVPRKKNKFMNFIKNTNLNQNLADEAWDLIEKHKQKKLDENSSTTNNPIVQEVDPHEDNHPPKKKLKKNDEESLPIVANPTPLNPLRKSIKPKVQVGSIEENNGAKEIKKKKLKTKANVAKNLILLNRSKKNSQSSVVTSTTETSETKLKNKNGPIVAINNTKKIGEKGKKTNRPIVALKNIKNSEEVKNGKPSIEKIKNIKKSEKKINKNVLKTVEANTNNSSTFCFGTSVMKVLKSKKEVEFVKLKSKIFDEYTKATGIESSRKTLKKLKKTLKNLSNVTMENNIVKLNM